MLAVIFFKLGKNSQCWDIFVEILDNHVATEI